MARKIFFIPALIAALFFTVSCGDLNVKPNIPDQNDVLGTPEQKVEAAATLYRDWFNAVHALKGPALGLATASDQITTTHGDAAAVDLAKEPREVFQNFTNYSFLYITKDFWDKTYQVVLLANDILRSMEDEKTIMYEGKDIKPMLTAWSYFIRGVGYGYLGLLFDQASLVDVHTPLPHNTYDDYHKVILFALTSLDSTITISQTHTFTLPDGFINEMTVSSDLLAGIASAYAARISISFPRNMAENEQNNWQKIYDYASQAPDLDVAPVADNDKWKDEYRQYALSTYWGRIDLRIIHLMDPDFPARWPADNTSWTTSNGQIPDSTLLSSDDARAVSDFIWDPPQTIEPPFYLNSFYRFSRYDDWMVTYSGNVPEFTTTEKELIMAEALVHLDRTTEAIYILNNGTRTRRGKLLPLDTTTPAADVLKAIFYEREIELIATGTGISFFDMRRRDMLQKGTPLHFPVPASELDILGLPLYTFGGVENADGINTSAGGWF